MIANFVKLSFAEVGVELDFTGEGVNEVGSIRSCSNPAYQLPAGKAVVAVDPEYFRPTEVDLLIGDATKARTQLGWVPKYDLAALVKEMMAKDVELA